MTSTQHDQRSSGEAAQLLEPVGRQTPAGPASSAPTRADDVVRLRGSVQEEHTLARRGAERLWRLLHSEDYVNALGALTGNQAVQQVRAGLKAIYLSGWQVAADANLAGADLPRPEPLPGQLGAAGGAADQQRAACAPTRSTLVAKATATARDWFAPIVADAEAGFGGVLNAFELMKAMIEAGAAGVHFEDQLASEKKCGHLGGKVLVPTAQHIRTLNAARLAADVVRRADPAHRAHRRRSGRR